MSDEDKSAEEHAVSDIEEKSESIIDKITAMANKEYVIPSFSVKGWMIGVVGLVLLILIFK